MSITINGNKIQWGSICKDDASDKNFYTEFNGRSFKDRFLIS